MFYMKFENENIDVSDLYKKFYEGVNDSTGTILIHHGKAKFPGKYVKNYSSIKLSLLKNDAFQTLENFAKDIYEKLKLNKLFVIHRIGTIAKNDTILFLAVESQSRGEAFEAVSTILEKIKDETLIGLDEIE